MLADQPIQPKPPRLKYATWMALTTLVAVAIAGVVAALFGASMAVCILAAAAVAVGSFATFLPSILVVDRQAWGLVVLVASMIRTLIILAITLFFAKTRVPADAHTALWIGAMCGAGLVLIVESAFAVSILSSMDKSVSSTARAAQA